MFRSLEAIVQETKVNGTSFYHTVLMSECAESGISEELAFAKMRRMYEDMRSADQDYEADLVSASGLVGTDGKKIQEARTMGILWSGDFVGRIMERAVKMSESNACMKRIVAAPTAGSCGVIPAVFLTVQEEKGFSDEQMTEALFVAAGIGEVIDHRAFLSGAAGGCQAEIGSASAMAAGGLAYLMGGNADQITHAAALALKNLLGLVCDPVAGLVEVPCVKRNVLGAVNALTSADLAVVGITSRIPPDEVIDAMRTVGKNMPENVRETGKGGLAATPTGVEIQKRVTSM